MVSKKMILVPAITFGVMAVGATGANADQVKSNDVDNGSVSETTDVGNILQQPTISLGTTKVDNGNLALNEGNIDEYSHGKNNGNIDVNDGTVSDPGFNHNVNDGSNNNQGNGDDNGSGNTGGGDTGSGDTGSDNGSGNTGSGDTGSDSGSGNTGSSDTGNGNGSSNTGSDTGSNDNPTSNSSSNSTGSQAVADATSKYNAILAENNGNTMADPVIQAKADLNKAIADSLPDTGMNKQAGISVVGIILTAIASGIGAFKFKVKKV